MESNFPGHLPHEKRRYCLDQLADAGASIEQDGERVFRVTLFKTHPAKKSGMGAFPYSLR